MDLRYKAFLISFCFIALPFGLNSSQASLPQQAIKNYSTLPAKQALVQNSVRAIAQDHHGFLWIGTLGGLHRFDGNQMILVNDLDLAGSSLDLIPVKSLFVDAAGDLWIGGVYGGLNRIRMADGSIESFSDLTRPFAIDEDPSIINIHEDSHGVIWLDLHSRVLRLDPHTRTIKKVDPIYPQNWGAEKLFCMIPLEDGLFLTCNSSSIGLYEVSENRILPLPFADGSFGTKPHRTKIVKLSDGSLWAVGDFSFVAEIKGEGKHRYLEPHQLPGSLNFNTTVLDKSGNLWLLTKSGQIYIYNPRTKNLFIQKPKFDGRVFTEDEWLVCLFCDRTGIMWLGTESYGLAFNDPSSTRFGNLSGRSDEQGHFKNPYIWDIKEAAGGVYLGGRFELGFMDSECHTYNRLVDLSGHPDFAQNQDLLCFLPLDENRFLMGHKFNSPGIFDLRDSSYTPTKTGDFKGMRAFVEGKNNQIWALGVYGCLLLDRDSLMPIELPPQLSKAIQGIELRALIEDDNGILWFGTQFKGLIRYDPATASILTWDQGTGPGDLPHNGVRSLYLDGKNNLWVGTYGGLVQLSLPNVETQKGNLKVFTTADGLPNNTIYDILPGQNGTLWLSTNLGLSNLDPETGSFRNFDKDDGLANNEFNGGAALIGPQGWTYFGGIDGVTWFKPRQGFRNLDKPRVALTRLIVGDTQEYSTFELPLLKNIKLPWNQNTIEVDLAALCFQQPAKQKVAYRIPEIDSTWWTASRGQTIRVTNLPAGDLHFEYKATNNNQVWSDTEVLLLQVGIPPWRSVPAISLYIFVILLVVFLTRYRYLHRQAQKEETIQQLALADKLTAVGQLAAGMAHDFNNQLQIIMGNVELLKLDLPAPHSDHKSLAIITRTGERAGFLASRLLAYANDTDPVRTTLNLDEVITDLQNMLASFLGARIELDFKPGPGDKLIYANREQMEQVLMNLCLNSRDAIKGNGSISITTSSVLTKAGKQMVIYEVRDSGRGITEADMKHIFDPFFTTKEEGKGSGLGLSMVNRIVKAHGGFMEVNRNNLGGATFKVCLPASKTSFISQEKSSVVRSFQAPDGFTILVADDEPAVNEFTTQTLTNAGFNVISVKNGQEGIDALNKHPEIQLAVLDVVMPVLDGRAVYEHIIGTGRDIPVLFCSGFSFSALKEDEFKDLDVPVLAKPFAGVDLLAAVFKLGNIKHDFD